VVLLRLRASSAADADLRLTDQMSTRTWRIELTSLDGKVGCDALVAQQMLDRILERHTDLGPQEVLVSALVLLVMRDDDLAQLR